MNFDNAYTFENFVVSETTPELAAQIRAEYLA